MVDNKVVNKGLGSKQIIINLLIYYIINLLFTINYLHYYNLEIGIEDSATKIKNR